MKSESKFESLDELQARVEFSNRDEISMTLKMSGRRVIEAEIKSVACPDCLNQIKIFKKNLRIHSADYSQMPLPRGIDHSSILIRELILRSRNEWKLPYNEVELCHCRNVPTAVVDACIISGAHKVTEIAQKTMAGTACGTCRPVTQLLIDYRLNDSD